MSDESTVENSSVASDLGMVSNAPEQTENEELIEGEEEQSLDSSIESTEDLEEAVEDAIEQGASKEEIKSMIREFELKVNGKTFNKKIDLSDEDAVKRELQKAYAGQLAMQQKAELEKSLQERVGMWKKDPSAIFGDLGLDVEDYLNQYMEQKLEESKKTPEQLAQESMQKELEEARRKEKELQERIQKGEYERLQEKAAAELEDQITTALDAHTDLPKSPRVVQKIADTMAWAIDNGFEEVTAMDVIPTVQKELRSELQSMFSDLPLEAIEALIGKQTFDRFRKDKLAKVNKKPKTLNEIKKDAAIAPAIKKDEAPRKRRKLDDFMRR